SSIMPQKRNPDLFELTRGRAAALQGDLAAVLALQTGLAGGYHRDFQLLKAPLWRGIDSAGEMFAVLAAAIPDLGVDSVRGAAAIAGGILATDEVMRRVRRGEPFRPAYRAVAEEVRRGVAMPLISPAKLLAGRRTSGGMGAVPFAALNYALGVARRWSRGERRRFERAIAALAGRSRKRR
ncbi:MAG: hypothetical protein ACREL5_09585, partial [Gemmatimonadales bacterium]